MPVDRELAFAKRMADLAGQIMQKYYRVDQHVHAKHDSSPVTIADLEINNLLVKLVQEEFPGHGVLGEEASFNQGARELWVCDPIDGTRGYTHHVPVAMFSLAYVVDGLPQVAVAYNPATKDLYWAVKSRGAFRNQDKINVRLNKMPVIGSTGSLTHGWSSRHNINQIVSFMHSKKWEMLNTGGLVFKGCLIAEGSIDGLIFGGKGAHDVAAVKLIIEEAGGKTTNIYGDPLLVNAPVKGAVLSNGFIHNELLALAALGIKTQSS